MKTIGILGGMSWESSAEYYRILNQAVRDRLGGFHSAKVLLYSLNFHEVETMQHQGKWEEAAQLLNDGALQLERGGAECLILATNTMHKLVEPMLHGVNIPFIHIVDPTARAILAEGMDTVGLLGTRYTMEEDFYVGRLRDEFGISVLIPDEDQRMVVDGCIYNELVKGKIRYESRLAYINVINDLVENGAQGIILGCTEIMLLIQEAHSPVTLFDTTRLHALAAVEMALSQE